jgi:hypothetical protein
MVSMGIQLGSGSPHWWWFAIKRRMHEGVIEEKEVKLALGALIEEAPELSRVPGESKPEQVFELWEEVAHCLVSGRLRPKTVVQELEHLLKVGRYVPMPSRAKADWSKGLALIKGGANYE